MIEIIGQQGNSGYCMVFLKYEEPRFNKRCIWKSKGGCMLFGIDCRGEDVCALRR